MKPIVSILDSQKKKSKHFLSIMELLINMMKSVNGMMVIYLEILRFSIRGL